MKVLVVTAAFALVIGGYFVLSTGSPNYDAAQQQLAKHLPPAMSLNAVPLSTSTRKRLYKLIEFLTSYSWPTSESTSLAHKLAYEYEAMRLGKSEDGASVVTYQLLLRAIWPSEPVPSP